MAGEPAVPSWMGTFGLSLPNRKKIIAFFSTSAIIEPWGYSSAGRALRSQRRGRGFEYRYLHGKALINSWCYFRFDSYYQIFKIVFDYLK